MCMALRTKNMYIIGIRVSNFFLQAMIRRRKGQADLMKKKENIKRFFFSFYQIHV